MNNKKKFFDFPSLRKKRNVLTISEAKACDGLPIHLFVNLTKTSKLIFRAFSRSFIQNKIRDFFADFIKHFREIPRQTIGASTAAAAKK